MSSVDELLSELKKLKDASDHLLGESKKALDQYRDKDGKLEGAYEPNFMAGYLYGVQEVRLFLSSILKSILDKHEGDSPVPEVKDETDTVLRAFAKVGLSMVALRYEVEEERLVLEIGDYTNGMTITNTLMVDVKPEDLSNLSDALKKLYFESTRDETR